MRFEDEHYIRVYKRDSMTMLMVSWEARAVLWETLRKCDRAGILELGDDGVDGLAVMIRVPVEVVRRAIPELTRRGVLELRDDGLLIAPRFVEAQEAKASDKARQKAARERARDTARAASAGVNLQPVTSRDDSSRELEAHSDNAPESPSMPPSDKRTGTQDRASGTEFVTPRDSSSRTVTKRHADSPGVTLSCAEQSRAEHIPDGAPENPKTTKQRRTREPPKPMTAMPEGFAVSPAIEAMCRAEKLPDPHVVFRDFRDKAAMNDYRYADWEAAFRTWMRSKITRENYPVWGERPTGRQLAFGRVEAAPPPYHDEWVPPVAGGDR